MPPQRTIGALLETLPSKVAEEPLQDEERYNHMNWEDTRRSRELYFWYNQEVEQHSQHILGYKFRQHQFNHFVQEQMEVNRFFLNLGVYKLMSSSIRDYVTQ